TREQRQQLAATVHPLLATRGVPGTHDVDLGCAIINQLKQSADRPVLIPVFNKAIDDRAAEDQWQVIDTAVDIILFEGWCVGAQPEPLLALQPAINRLEAEEDRDARWRYFVNQQLADEYQQLFSLIDYLVMLKVPAMASVFEWRYLQEQKLAEVNDVEDHRLMDEKGIRRFIMHYERITRHLLEELPQRADLVLYLNQQHQVDRVSIA
ncbi:MAG: hypothetical protein OEY43_09920, partial [Gammaproteobacteria bacterium]|nr:hypothetical protein [Gammaproteobacteria bacterium]